MNGGRAGAADRLGALAVVAAVAAAYGPAAGRYFTSEDFLLLRFLAEHPPWADLGATFGGPWLGVTIVGFYRPVATLLFALEGRLFGAEPLAFNVVHLAVHAANALLVAALARRVQRRFLPGPLDRVAVWAAALLFAVHPLHPNAVLFAASFAPLFATTFLLLATVSYLRFREGGGRSARLASIVAFALALGSYEAAVVLPALLFAAEALAPPGPIRDPRARAGDAARALAPHVVLAAVYLGLRHSLFGVVLGGYPEAAQELVGLRARVALSHLDTSISRLVLPLFDGPSSIPPGIALGLAALAPLGLHLWARGRVPPGHPRLCAFAASWLLVSMAPFAFVPVVPATSRYWYAASVGAAIGVPAFARWLGAAFPRGRAGLLGLPAALLAVWAVLLVANVGTYREAGETARAVQAAVLRAEATDGASRRFVAGYPLFVTNRAGVALAQVFHYGLADALRPPFVPAPGVDVAPLPPLPAAAFAPLERLPGARLYAWAPAGSRLRRLPMPAMPPATLVLQGPPDGARFSAERLPAPVVVPSGTHRRLRLVLVAAGNPSVVDVPARDGANTLLGFPREFVLAMRRLYPGRPVLWWVVAEDAGGAVSAVSPVRHLVPQP